MISSLPPDHPPIPTTSSQAFPTVPPPACPMSLLAQSRPTRSPAEAAHPYAGEVFTLGTRNSKLAMVQTEIVRRELEERWPGCEIRIFGMTTLGDNVQTQPLYTFGGKALWTKELEVALLNNQVDAIVHSLKDVPTEFPPGCALGAVLEREDPSDALVVKEGLPYTSLAEMPEGSVIGTSSVRRVAQLRRKFPGLKFADVRGNLGTRLKKLDDPSSSYTALILASAGLIRLNLGHRITAPVTSPALYHAVGQGAIGIEVREGDARAAEVIGSLECWKTSWRTRAERMMLHVLEGGCSVPVGCETTLTEVFVRGGEGDTPPPEMTAPQSPRKVDTHGLSVTRDPLAPRVPVSPEQVNDLPLPLSPRTQAALKLPLSPSEYNIAEPDDTTGIPAGHPAVNPAHVCPVTGRMLPGAPLSSPPLRAGAARGPQEAFSLPALHACTHRPGRTPACPAGERATHHATLTLTGTITSLSGTHGVRCTLSRRVHGIDDAEQLGADVARELVESGGREILTELGRHVKEVGGADEQHDGNEIPLEAPGAVPIAGVPAPAQNGTAAHAAMSKSPAKSPHSLRGAFRGDGDKCLRPAGW
ncbi:porphobilinogen deaminase [Rhodotorula kratochvilovae]